MAENLSDVTKESYFKDLLAILALTGLGYAIVIKLIDWYKSWKEAPIILGDKEISETSKELTINIPSFWVPYQPGDTVEGVGNKFKPEISVEGDKWIINFKPITCTVKGLVTTYDPKPIKIPIVPSISTVSLAAKLFPKVEFSSLPPGWTVTFQKITILA